LVEDHFPKTQNLEYAILKTHLIIENLLTQYIRCTSVVLVEPESLRFSFAQKLEIAILHGFGSDCPFSVPAIELLNRIRNQVAHRLTFDMQLVNEMIRINSDGGEIDVRSLTDRRRISFLRRWCYWISGLTLGHMIGKIEGTMRDRSSHGARER
jgi:hypothetical protein